MKLITLFELLVLGAQSCLSSNSTHHHDKREAGQTGRLHPSFCGSRPGFLQSKIVGGETARPGEIPWQAAVVRKRGKDSGQVVCGAALISERIVLTAAHCFKLEIASYEMWVGNLYSGWAVKECSQQRLRISTVKKHPSFSSKSLKNDLAVVMVESQFGQGVQFSRWVVPACLPHITPPLSGRGLVVSGWGLLSEQSRRLSPSLQVVEVSLKPQSECVAAYRKLTPLISSQMCAGVAGGGRDSCAGDSGGPMVLLHSGRYFLAGLVSFGRGCGRETFPGVYTKLEPYLPWVMETLASLGLWQESKETEEPEEHSVTSVCQGQSRYIWCQWGSVIKVTAAFYGRLRQDSQCPISLPKYYRYDCGLSTAEKELAGSCNGKRSCQVSPEPRPRGQFSASPCPSYLQPWLSLTFLCLDMQGRTASGGVNTG